MATALQRPGETLAPTIYFQRGLGWARKEGTKIQLFPQDRSCLGSSLTFNKGVGKDIDAVLSSYP